MTMFTTQLLDSLPILGVFVAFAIVLDALLRGWLQVRALVSGTDSR